MSTPDSVPFLPASNNAPTQCFEPLNRISGGQRIAELYYVEMRGWKGYCGHAAPDTHAPPKTVRAQAKLTPSPSIHSLGVVRGRGPHRSCCSRLRLLQTPRTVTLNNKPYSKNLRPPTENFEYNKTLFFAPWALTIPTYCCLSHRPGQYEHYAADSTPLEMERLIILFCCCPSMKSISNPVLPLPPPKKDPQTLNPKPKTRAALLY